MPELTQLELAAKAAWMEYSGEEFAEGELRPNGWRYSWRESADESSVGSRGFIECAKAAIASLREPAQTLIDSDSYRNGDWSRRNIEAFLDEVLK
jgi:hypothetical protein